MWKKQNSGRYKISALIAMILALPALILSGCAGNDPAGSGVKVTENVQETETHGPEATSMPSPTEKPTPVPDPSTVTLMIEDFNNITNVKKAMNPVDLSAFGIVDPEFSFDSEYAQEGVALVNTL